MKLANEFAGQSRGTCRIVGIAGSQGSGKTTLAREIVMALQERGKRAALLSLDDYYLSKAEREQLANTVHPLLATRGVPGTHDVKKLCQAIEKAKLGDGQIQVPVFDKLADDVSAKTREITLPIDVLVVEGWCLGAQPQRWVKLSSPVNALERKSDKDVTWRKFVNDALKNDYARLNALLDELVFLKAPDFDVVTQWRTKAEREAYAAIGEIPPRDLDRRMRDFVAHYERLTRHMLDGGVHPTWVVKLNGKRKYRMWQETDEDNQPVSEFIIKHWRLLLAAAPFFLLWTVSGFWISFFKYGNPQVQFWILTIGLLGMGMSYLLISRAMYPLSRRFHFPQVLGEWAFWNAVFVLAFLWVFMFFAIQNHSGPIFPKDDVSQFDQIR